jgi:twinkle protein
MSKFKEKKVFTDITVDQIQGFPIRAIPERGLSEETCQHFGIRSEYSEVTGTVIAHYFPQTKAGKVVGYVRRDLRRSKKDGFSTVGQVDIHCDLFGQAACSSGGKKLFIVEGMYDAPSAWQALWENWGKANNVKPNVVSISLGAGNAASHIASNIEWVKGFQIPVLCFDNDEDGREGVGQCSVLLGNFHDVLLPVKDPNELLLKDSKQLHKLLSFSKEYQPECINPGGVDVDTILTPIQPGLRIEAFPQLMKMMRGFRKGELTIILAPPKCGKTTLCKEINYHLLLHKEPTVGFYLEEDNKKTTQSFVARHAKIHLPEFRVNPSRLSREFVENVKRDLLDPAVAMFGTADKGHIGPDQLMQSLRHCYVRGARFAIIDHLSYIFSGMSSTNERQDIDKLLTDLAAFVRESGMHIIAVSHIKRPNVTPPRDKEGNIRYPFWVETQDTDGRGSGAFEQLCWNMIGLSKQIEEDKQLRYTRVDLLLSREYGTTGKGDVLEVNPHTGILTAVEREF